jgi:ABC-type transport system involved in multi-copper enzyme maturation permease subunit
MRRNPTAATALGAIALNTFREAVRDRVLYLLLVFALVVIGTARLLSLLTVGDEIKIIMDVGLSAISLFGTLTAVFVGVSLVFKEIERRTIWTLLAQPVRRWQFVGGKYLGLLAVLGMNVASMTLVLAAVLLWHGRSPLALLPAILLILVELAVITAFALLLSSVTNPMLAALGTLAVSLMGHLVWSLELLREKLPPGAGRWLCDALYWLLPNLHRLDLKTEAVHGLPVSAEWVVLGAAYGLGYAVLVLALACVAFERRDFT